jgi:hypothetical protein
MRFRHFRVNVDGHGIGQIAWLAASQLSASYRAGFVMRLRKRNRPAPEDHVEKPDRPGRADARLFDVEVTGFSPDFVARVVRIPERAPQVVPAGHYFLMGEARINQDVSEYWGQHSGERLERAR